MESWAVPSVSTSSAGTGARPFSTELFRRGRTSTMSRELEPENLPAEARFNSRRCLGRRSGPGRAGRCVGQLVCLFEVLRCQQHCHPVVGQLANGVPQLLAAARVEPRAGLVQEEEIGSTIMLIARSSRRRMPPEYVPARRFRASARSNMASNSVVPRTALARKVTEPGHHLEVLLTAEEVVDRGELRR